MTDEELRALHHMASDAYIRAVRAMPAPEAIELTHSFIACVVGVCRALGMPKQEALRVVLVCYER